MTLPLVLLPGMMCDARLFGPQVDRLGRDREVTIPDIGGADAMARVASDVLARAPDRFVLGGLSMGGIVAMEMCRQAPDRIAALALLDTNHLTERAEVKARRALQIEKVRHGGLREVMAEEMKPNYLGPNPRRDEILDLCMEMAEALGPQVFIRQSAALRDRPDQTDTLRNIAVPTLILCGANDVLCPPERHAQMHDLIPDSELIVVSSAGHLPTLEAPDFTTDALQAWLNRVAE